MSSVVHVAVNAPIREPLSYLSEAPLHPGTRVKVPLGKRKVEGVVLGPGEPSDEFQLKSVHEIIEDNIPLPGTFLSWCQWMAQYYHQPLGTVLTNAFPPLKKEGRKTRKSAIIGDIEPTQDLPLTDDQAAVLDAIPLNQYSSHLIHGVTGSGKTEVYLQLLREVLKSGKTGLVLVPEIALTPQLIERFAARFGQKIAVIHSQLTPREKTNQWWAVLDGKCDILIGARSALFCPIPNLGAIIVDEEHDSSYKQDEKFRYHGRDAAVKRAHMEGVPILLGSATPSLESFYNAKQRGIYHYHHMSVRVRDLKMPNVEVIDLRSSENERDPEKHEELPFWLSPPLYEKMKTYLDQGQQVACFLNRRGMANVVMCSNCGAQKMCPDCDISLTLHNNSRLVCHYCGYDEKFKEPCGECGDGFLEPLGLGTEKVEEDLLKLFPEKVVTRADRDVITDRESWEGVVASMQSGETDILVGTQMISKGLHFPKLNLVAVVLADIALNMPDFRASERAFQLLTQVAGRAGRQSQGEVVIQTYNPEHIAIQYARNHDYLSFAEQELEFRSELAYPPAGKVVVVRALSMDQPRSKQAMEILAQRIHLLCDRYQEFERVQVLGPAPCPMLRVRNKYRYMLMLKGPEAPLLSTLVQSALGDNKWVPARTQVIVDVDPMNMM